MTSPPSSTRTVRREPSPRADDVHAQSKVCAMCPKLCNTACPVQEATGRESVAPWRISRTVRDAQQSGWTPPTLHAAASCTGCGACSRACLAGVTLPDTTRAARAEAAAAGVELAAAERVRTRLRDRRRPRRRDALGDLVGDPVATTAVLFGCDVQSRSPGIGRGAHALATAAGEMFRVLAAPEPCCGAAALDVGLVTEAAELAQEAAAALVGVERVVPLSPGCARTIRDEWRHLGVHSDVSVVSAPEWLDDLTSRFPGTQATTARTVAWHDPCTLARGMGVLAPPRAVLARLGVTLLEPAAAGLDTRCSGAGAAYPAVDPAGAALVAGRRRAELEALGAQLVTACPSAARALGAEDLVAFTARTMLDGP